METVMIVDDDPAIREVFTLFLERAGYLVHAAPGGKECLDLLKAVQPDLLLLDIMMEPMDGWETLDAIKSNNATRQVPVMMVSAKQPTRTEILQHGSQIEEYIFKPIEFAALFRSIASVIEHCQDVQKEAENLEKAGGDRNVIHEYYNLVRSVTNIKKLMPRFRYAWGGDEDMIRVQEEHLIQIRKNLGLGTHRPLSAGGDLRGQ
jgi:two-component system OmpR family response regulator